MYRLYYVRLRLEAGEIVHGSFRAQSGKEALDLARSELGDGGEVEEVATGDAALAAKRADQLREAHFRVDDLSRRVTLGDEREAWTLHEVELGLENLRDTTLGEYSGRDSRTHR